MKRRTTKKTRWNIRKLISLLGGDTHVSRMLDAYGYRAADRKTVQGWKRRGALPGTRLSDLLALATDMGIAVNLPDYIMIEE